MKSVGVTGGIGSGKSIVCKIFEVMGYPVFYADVEAKKCMVEDAELVLGVKKLLGEEAYLNGELNRPFVAEQIFSSSDMKAKMDALFLVNLIITSLKNPIGFVSNFKS